MPGTACPSEPTALCLARSQHAASPAKGLPPPPRSLAAGCPVQPALAGPGLGKRTHHSGAVEYRAGVPRGGPWAPWLTEKPRGVPAPSRHGASKCPSTSGKHRLKQSTGHDVYMHAPRCPRTGKGVPPTPDHRLDMQNERGLWRTAGPGLNPIPIFISSLNLGTQCQAPCLPWPNAAGVNRNQPGSNSRYGSSLGTEHCARCGTCVTMRRGHSLSPFHR